MNEVADALAPYILAVGLVSIRVGVTLAAMPAPFGSLTPIRIRVALGLIIATLITLPHMGELGGLSNEPFSLLGVAVGELLVGTVIGLTVRVTLAAAETAGTLAGLSMGLGFASSVDPLFEDEAIPTTQIFGLLGVLIFFVMRGHHVVIAALAESLRLLPLGRGADIVTQAGVFTIGRSLLAQGLRVAAPVVATLFIVQLGVGLVSRSAPRIQLFALTFAMTASAGLMVLVIAIPTVATAISEHVGRLERDLSSAVGGL